MASWRETEEDYNYTLDQVLKKIDTTYKSKINLRERSDYDLFDEEIKNEFDDLYWQ
ncbi:hypothetical protein [Alkalibaculum sporogenes]|uniref:hypothetical protein n=1 Tax=Alkalibaculum sporogenes TaxID=2655001 RepID=UPI00187B6942|nr:hypothetical protein [Alkalibaculum sporogenes]